MTEVVSHCYKRSGMVSNLLKWWRDDFATVKRQRNGFGAYRKETGCHPTPLQAVIMNDECMRM
jgi:hypothetical protein